MPVSTVEIRNVAGTQAAMGWADAHTVVIDRPEGRAGGMGLGFNGAQLLGLTIGGCFANDLRYVAADLGVAVGDISISVSGTRGFADPRGQRRDADIGFDVRRVRSDAAHREDERDIDGHELVDQRSACLGVTAS